ncbi:MAG: dTDP-glucose 4,6-dehydratase [Calditrichaeota bacterium]|nr:dTDP-glucose 4,6-dehydratase [Calditrichota bacterium]RQW00756.1 MAG: dTDP-glucose 4,6-dehydratase [Calditrichota bacterium]
MKSILVTGGAGFIGSNFVRYMVNKYPDYKIIVLDALTYAGNRENLQDLEERPNYEFFHGNICDREIVEKITANCEAIINFAAETHVDRSILEAGSFIQTDVVGTHTLLEAARKFEIKNYIQISTDEVYGSIEDGSFTEAHPLQPNSPYSASKASGDLLVRAYHKTYGMPVIITRSSNNYGPYQYPEKLIPLFITNALEDKPLPLYGDGKNVRDWLYVLDNCEAIDMIFHKGEPGEVYNIGGGNEMQNIEITRLILDILDKPESLIKPVSDRLGHDRRYSVSIEKVKKLGWQPRHDFIDALKETIRWYQENQEWWRRIKEKQEEFKKFYQNYYKSLN